MIKYILGIQSYANHDSGAAIIKFGKNIKPEFVAISEERVLRKNTLIHFLFIQFFIVWNILKLKN